jgi:predicted O-methyltransferase YrrM
MDGGGTTFRLKNLLLGGFLVFKVDSDATQFWFDSLRPYVHYIPVSRDNFEQDLMRKVQWATDHDADAEQIAANAQKFALEHLGDADAHWQQQAALSMYAQRQNFIPVGADAEMERFCCKDAVNVNLMQKVKLSSLSYDCVDVDPACASQAAPKEMLYSGGLHEPVVLSGSTLETLAKDLNTTKDVLLSVQTGNSDAAESDADVWRAFADVIKDFNLVEGHIMEDDKQAKKYAEYAKRTNVQNICETGFNAGHSALLFLLANPDAHVYSFDDARYDVTMPAVKFLANKFPKRFTFIQGDSQKTLPEFRTQYPGVKCDLAVVDGGHVLPWVNTDLLNFWHMAVGPESMIIMSDTPCKISWCNGPTDAWNAMVNAGAVTPTEVVNINDHRGYSLGVFSKQPGKEDALATLPVDWPQSEQADLQADASTNVDTVQQNSADTVQQADASANVDAVQQNGADTVQQADASATVDAVQQNSADIVQQAGPSMTFPSQVLLNGADTVQQASPSFLQH